MSQHKIDLYDILDKTDGGLDIILKLYPDANESVHKKNRKFKIRSEKTASTSLHKKSDPKSRLGYIYLVTDFGSTKAKGNNAVACYMEEYGVDFVTALNELAAQYDVQGADPGQLPNYTFSKQPATTEQEEGTYHIELKDSFTDFEIETVFARNVLANLGWFSGEEKKKRAYTTIKKYTQRYNFHPVAFYTYIKNREELKFASNEKYPIYAWIEPLKTGTFTKVYQPLHQDKSRRFFSTGARPTDFLHGLKQLQEEVAKREAEYSEDFVDEDNKEVVTINRGGDQHKVDKVIYMSGGSDALNVAVLGYPVIWPNSETAEFTKDTWFNLLKLSKEIYQLQDIDATGLKSAHRNAMEHLDMRTIELPHKLLALKDRRGNPCKDVRDFFAHFKVSDFEALVRTALPYRFWDYKPKYSGKGEDKKFIGYSYEFNNVQAYNFLGKNGFYRLNSPARKSGYMFIKLDGNIVTEIESNEVKNFVHTFLRERMMDNELRNAMFRTTQLSDSSLSNLPLIEIDFTDNGKDEQYYMFPNKTLRINASGIEEYKPGSVQRFVWNDDVIDFHWRREDPTFRIEFNNNSGAYDIEILRTDCIFLNYLIQTSRVHWRVELEGERIQQLEPAAREAYRQAHKFDIAGPLLKEDEIFEQKQHLINKIFSIGYLLHRYKDPNRPWCIFAMDNNISEDGGSYGGSGKSILYNIAIPQVLRKQFYIGGRNPKVTDNQFIYDGLTEHHRYIYIDDANEFLNFHFFFDAITGSLKVNPKNTSPYKIPFEKVGKYAITSNYTLRNIDASVERRILYTVFSDYYHNQGETTDYNESRSPALDFGKNMFEDFTRDEWNTFYNTMMDALVFYFQTSEKLNPPMSNVTTRNLMTEMGADFEGWAASYFAAEGGNVDRLIVREEAFKDFDFRYRKGWKTQRFSKALRAFCKLNNYILNPEGIINSNGKRCIHKVDEREQMRDGTWRNTERKVAKEMMYIQTRTDIPLNLNIGPSEWVDKSMPPVDPNAPAPNF